MSRLDDVIATKSVQITYCANGTRYRLLVQTDPEGGWLVCWLDAAVFGRGYEHDLHESPRGHVLRIYTWWGERVSTTDRANIELAAGAAVVGLGAL